MKTPGEGGPNRGSTLSVHAQPGAFPVATTSYTQQPQRNHLNPQPSPLHVLKAQRDGAQ